ncbi:hypothetical protein [Hydrogenimonas thermophila]|uniref:Periplasmic protein n=1 Tax=Hydrogenimonas thermophila TaxID=223786 RepID=A0A1I5QSY7_9BACT|nr:hypothetical protein [Hydrogenimonas thermophila]WOE69328.1 hypothetical protein RZR91_09440 [Hydrogenimonas thermophila]WOE71838.1 hypothetical protein RZR97_09415 [Hydrogenimonas thermophila]SFP49250.1 hypothetical protein SAMN05216234_1229 [Hydrogenimonas thermophila]
MGRLLLIVAGTIITVALLILFLLLYRYATQDAEGSNIHIRSDTKRADIVNKPQVSNKWIEELAQKKRPSFSYPVKEIQIELPLVKKSNIKETYRLVLKKMDDYKLFCIKQIFNSRNLPFALYAEKEQTVVIVHNVGLTKLSNIAKYVKSYGIDLQIENYEKKD